MLFQQLKLTVELDKSSSRLVSMNDFNLISMSSSELILTSTTAINFSQRMTLIFSDGGNHLSLKKIKWLSYCPYLFWSLAQEDVFDVSDCAGQEFSGGITFLQGNDAKEVKFFNFSVSSEIKEIVQGNFSYVELRGASAVFFGLFSQSGLRLRKGNVLAIFSAENLTFKEFSLSNNSIAFENSVINITNVKQLLFEKSSVSFNSGIRSGTVFLENVVSTKISATKFVNNTVIDDINNSEDFCIIDSVKSRGGALYIRNSSTLTHISAVFILEDCYFENNNASLGLDIFFDYFDINIASFKNTVFKNNSTNKFSSFVGKFLVYNLFLTNINSSSGTLITFDKLNPGNPVMIAEGYDEFGNILNMSCYKDVNISLEDPTISNEQKYLALKLAYVGNVLYIEAFLDRIRVSDTSANYISMRSNSLLSLINKKSRKTLFLSNVSFDLNFTCHPGFFFSLNGLRCSLCPKNTFKLEYSIDNVCDRCPKNKMESCEGGMNITLKRGYFLEQNSSLIFKCRNPEACERSKCSAKFINSSFLCSRCQPGYGISRDWGCADCSTGSLYFFLALYVITLLSIKGYSVNKGYKLTKNLKKSVDKNKNEFSREYTIFHLASTNSLLKILSIHFSFIFSLLSYPFPSLEELDQASPLIWNLEPVSLSFECLFKVTNINVSPVYISIMLRFMTPVTIFVFWTFFYGTKILRKRARIKEMQSTEPEEAIRQKRKHLILRTEKDRRRFIDSIIIDLMRNHSFEAIVLITITVCFDDLITGFGQILSPFDTVQNEKQVYRMLWEPDKLWWDGHNFLAIIISLPLAIFLGMAIPFYIVFQ